MQFYLDNVPNGGLVATAPFQHDFGPLFVGDHLVRASVADSRGWVSNSVAATVHITGPLGATLAPTNGASFNFGQAVSLLAAPGGGELGSAGGGTCV